MKKQDPQIHTRKDIIRRNLKKTRQDIPVDMHAIMSKKIHQRLKGLDEYKNLRTLSCYISIEDEVETRWLIKEMLRDGKELSIPYIDVHSHKMRMGIIKDLKEEHMQIGEYDIPEPSLKEGIEPNEIELIIVPGLAFDGHCNRLGRGKGYYDAFLQETRGVKIGLAFDSQVIATVPHDKNDIPMDMIITEKRIIRKTNGGEK
ncbi:5-formyltetrahydrofolate cyclo-ligase [Candidatus Woesearchaeota archaeon]|nr:5-formyltetrahydrofolate cyclo-ligase [Candidatus Woesearchaeota archaeon]